ncbi:hypothetical protein FB45DRAFT_1022212 [Roridomyces roridus]|uniref:Uncharacterized protein n=1 Tax=Roridomyces roridus TaxID=1738132 RepID=A0AAD7FWM5_9AGAR|nr:hypothetical protein FB45DRAFT_1022212 [Roridomyces roridus]
MAPRNLRSFLLAVVVLSILPIYLSKSSCLDGWLTSRPRLPSILPVPSKTYVISLPRRTDRREKMERLREHLGVEWSYFDAGEAGTPLVTKIVDQVHPSARTLSSKRSVDFPQRMARTKSSCHSNGQTQTNPLGLPHL